MKKAYRNGSIGMMLVLPVLCLAALLVFAQRAAAHLGNELDRGDEVAARVQTLRSPAQGTVVLPIDEEDVTITKTAALDTARVGATVQYNVVVENSSDLTVTAHVSDDLPTELRLLRSFTGTATLPPLDTGAFTATVDIAPMDAVTLTYEALVRSVTDDGGPIVNTAVAEISLAEGSFVISDSASISVTLSFIPLAIIRTASLDLLENGGFENGSDGSWIEVGSRGTLIVDDTQLPEPIAPHAGSFAGWVGGFPVDTSLLVQNIDVPQGYREMYLQYHYWIDSSDSSCGDDIYAAGAYLPDGTGAATNASGFLCTPANTNEWAVGCVDLAPLGGRSVDIAFITLLSDDGVSSLFIDDVSIEQICTPTAVPTLLEH